MKRMVLHLFCKAFKMSAHSWPPSINYLFPQVWARTSKVCSLSVMIIHFCKVLCLAWLLLNIIAASPDAKLVGGGSEMLLEVKCVCPFVEKDDGRGWVWLPSKRAPEGVSVKHFCAMPSANAGYKCFALSASSLGCTRVQSFLCAI